MTVRAAAALAAAMGIGRFVYTPILPLMTAQAGLSATSAAGLATANYLGYFVGALITVVRAPSRVVNRVALVLLVATLAGMPLTHGMAAWFVLRLVAGVASALVFVAAVNARPRWGMSGVGVGIALSGLLVLGWGQWQAAWWAAAVCSALLAAGAWRLELNPPELSDQRAFARSQGPAPTHSHRAFAVLFTAYTLEGVGYIIAGTFLVAAISGPLGSSAWILVGLSAALSPIVIRPHRHALPAALAIQAIGIALPALIDGSALIATILFGGTFIGIAATALKLGEGFPNAAAILTAGYSAGQIIGPLVATPLLHHGYDQALLLASGIVATAAITALAPPSRHRDGARTPRRSPRAAPAE
ncbi:MFS transporter [Lentzea pudingi]|uniref:MFS transporter n=1 Tax=Lentzea pudingi TaxID=1789439 RepID=A0ABQ2IK02_9PSEU|nr:YbfB/YjiJ family MFS transporter [Lentzea pudingi]GGN10072.1 MFS transporter [Lentzea pudingi]